MFSADGRLVALAPDGADGLTLLDPKTGDVVHQDPVAATSLSFDPVGGRLAVGENTRVRIYDVGAYLSQRRFGVPGLEIRQEFGDTRHRWVTYTLKAVTRFREYFEPDEPVELFQRGVAVSPTTLADPVSLPPDRRLVIDREGGGVRITLTGTGPQPANRMELVLEEADGAGTVSDLTELAVDPALRVAAWRPVPGATVTGDGTPAVLTLPPGTAPLQLRVREVEHLDGPAGADLPADLRERTVFLDVVALPEEWRPV